MKVISVSKFSLYLIAFALSSNVLADTASRRVLESRYLSAQLGPEPTQVDLLQSVIDRRIPQATTTVGEALVLLLGDYGFQLEASPPTDDQYLLMMLPLPEPHRQVGPMTLGEVLTTLSGTGFEPVINPVKRSVLFQLREGFHHFVTENDRARAKAQWVMHKDRPSAAVEMPPPDPLKLPENHLFGPVQPGDSLSRFASQLDHHSLTIDQLLVHLFQANPHAFANRNMNHLLTGVTLTMPPVDRATVPTAAEASRVVDTHYRVWTQEKRLP